LGKYFVIAFATVSPPIPESKIPIGDELSGFM
jgi:hypothetical protein